MSRTRARTNILNWPALFVTRWPIIGISSRPRFSVASLRVWKLQRWNAWTGNWRHLPPMRRPRTFRPLFIRSRSEEHTSELQSLMRISYAVFCLKQKKYKHDDITKHKKKD